MATATKRITVNSLEFGDPPFRRLKKINIAFAERVTLIAGHNGIGKSTILGLIANTFGLTERGSARSYFGEPYYANIERIVYLSLKEVAKSQENPDAAIVTSTVNGVTVRKRCSMTQRTEWKRARVVPRTIDRDEEDPVGQDAKIPLPTIYLGVKRLASVGEADEKDVESSSSDMDPADRSLMAEFINMVVLGSKVTDDVTSQRIRSSKKSTAQPGYENHEALAVSVGQDSLASIGTALASFNKLKREHAEEYVGGLLVVDELDVGFHPHAIDRLTKALKTFASRLSLQIVATTHSPRLIEALHADGDGDGDPRSPDSVVYLLDTKKPRLAEDQSLKAILDDMAQREGEQEKKPVVFVYFEDDEGAQFCEALLPPAKRGALGRHLGVKIQLVPLGVGGSNLIGLPEKDPLFMDRVLIVDADTTIPRKALQRGNALKLPCVEGSGGTNRSPENTVKNFLRAVADTGDGPLNAALLRFGVRNPSSDKIYSTFFSDDSGASSQRGSSKNWWKDHLPALKSWGVVREWAACYPTEVAEFHKSFALAVEVVAKRLR